jgi:hypothetical protein
MVIKNKATFYALSFSWGIIMTLVGCVVAIALLVTGHRPKKWGHCFYFEVGKRNWGGMELGIFFLTNKNPSNRIRNHEHGHGFQNCAFGPFMIVISLMSMCRYWYRELKYNRKGLTPPTAYDDAWYEGQATQLGTEFIESLNK